jgi:putative ABC transport system permease protein
VLVACTALAGVLPARRAARVSPVAALATDG